MSKARDLADSVAAGSVLADGVVSLSEVGGGTNNGVVFVNGSGTTTSGSALTFDGSILDVTGTVVADGLTVDGTATINNNIFTISSTTPSIRITETDVADKNTQLIQASGTFRIRTASDDYSATTERLRIDSATGDISFYEDTGTTPKLFWDASAESLGIGTDSPNAILDVQGEGTLDTEIEYAILRGGGSSQPCLRIGGNNTTSSSIRHAFINSENINGSAQALAFQTGGSEAMRITSDGNVGIGTDSPSADGLEIATKQNTTGGITELFVTGNTSGASVLGLGDGNNRFVQYIESNHGDNSLRFHTFAGNYGLGERVRITSDGSVGIGTDSPNATLEVSVGGANRAVRLYNSDTALSDTELAHAIEFTQNDAASPNGTNAWIKTFGNGSTGNLDLAFATGGSNSPAERMRIDSSGNVGIGTAAPTEKLDVNGTIQGTFITSTGSIYATSGIFRSSDGSAASPSIQPGVDSDTGFFRPTTNTIGFSTAGSERVRIDASGNVMFRTTNATPATSNVEGHTIGITAEFSRSGSNPVDINRVVDGSLIIFRGQGVSEGSINVAGTTVSLIGGHLARWAQTVSAKNESLVKGTVLSNLDEMNVYVAPTTYWTEKDELPEGVNVGDLKVAEHQVDNEQLNKVKVSDVEGDANVAGVFVNWDYDEAHNVDEINMAMTGDMIIRIAAGTTVVRGDLLMSAGDGTAKPQGDDIVRSKTIAKVTSTHVTCTYEDGSFCVPCVLMAC